MEEGLMEENRDRTFIITARHAEEKRRLAGQMRREMTPGERLLWQRLRANRLGGLHFRRQQIIDGFIADFFCHAARLVVEVDGGIHAERQEYDAERDRLFAARGLCVLRITNSDLKGDLEGALRTILRVARERLPQDEGCE